MNHLPTDTPLIPANRLGKALDLESSVTENSVEEAITTFNQNMQTPVKSPGMARIVRQHQRIF